MTYLQARIKQKAEHILLLPLILLGRAIGYFYRKPGAGSLFLICPNRDTGGSYKVNADIARLLAPYNPLVIFTKREKNGGMRLLYEMEGLTLLDIGRTADNKYLHFLNVIWRGIIAQWVKQCKNPVVFGGESIYFYKVLPHVYRHATCIELCHVNKWLNYTQAFAPMIDWRVFSTQKIMRDHAAMYHAGGIPASLLNRLRFIDNKIELPEPNPLNHEHLRVLFAGRGTPQKRVHLVAAIAEKVKADSPGIDFTLVGDVENLVPQGVQALVSIRTDISNARQMIPVYQSHDILLLTSSFEGLPLVVMDMMALGRVVVSTAVDAIPDYIQHLENGMLIHEVANEEEVVRRGTEIILQLEKDRALLKKLGEKARHFALEHFCPGAFDRAWLNMFGIDPENKSAT